MCNSMFNKIVNNKFNKQTVIKFYYIMSGIWYLLYVINLIFCYFYKRNLKWNTVNYNLKFFTHTKKISFATTALHK